MTQLFAYHELWLNLFFCLLVVSFLQVSGKSNKSLLNWRKTKFNFAVISWEKKIIILRYLKWTFKINEAIVSNQVQFVFIFPPVLLYMTLQLNGLCHVFLHFLLVSHAKYENHGGLLFAMNTEYSRSIAIHCMFQAVE